jgi:predicted permease
MRRRRREEALDRELRAHLESETEDQKQAGLAPEEARYAAQRVLGNLSMLKEDTRAVWGWGWLEPAAHDLRAGLRMFVKIPGFTATVVLALALGIGANTAIFSIIHAVLLRPLPYRDPEQLVAIWQSSVQEKGSKLFASYRDFENWRDNSRSLAQLGGVTWATEGQVLTGHGPPRNVLAIPATVGLFSLLGVEPSLGRVFQDEDLSRGCTVVLAHRFWQSVLGAQPGVVGQSLQLDAQSCTVLGVMPPGFVFYPEPTQLWTLITPNSAMARNPDRSGIGAFGRLKPGVSKESAESELRLLARQIDDGTRYGAKMEPAVYPLQQEFTWMAGRNLRLSLVVLFAAVSMVLLIACVNVANLLLGRSLVRQREVTIRAALGSSRGRLFRQLLTESLLLSFAAAAIGTLLAVAAVRYFRATNPVPLPPGNSVSIDVPVLVFTVALAILTAVLFGSLPAWRTSRVDLTAALKAGGRHFSGTRKHRLAKVLITAEVVLSIVLLAGAGLLIQSVARLTAAPVGFQTARLVMLPINPPPREYAKPEQRMELYQRILDNARSLPALQDAALSTAVPLRGSRGINVLEIEGRPAPTPQTARHDIAQQAISGTYVRLMGIPLLSGRDFDGRDSQQAGKAAIVNQALARKYFPGENPIGKRIRIFGEPDVWSTIVGLIDDEKRSTVYQEMGWVDSPIVYRPLAQQAPSSANLLIRTKADQVAIGAAVQQSILKSDPSVLVGKPETVEHLIYEYLKYPRFRAILLGAFAAMALLLAAVGLYGVLSQLVAQRTQEIGLRMALGAQKRDVLAMIVKEGMLLTSLGIGLGLLLTSFLTRFVGSLLYGVAPHDPQTLCAVSIVLLTAAFLATYLPARRAATIDPMEALRYE